MRPNRRQFMATGAVAGAGLLAGCSLNQIPFIGGGGLGSYPNWIPTADTLASDDEENPGISFSVTSPSQISDKRDNLHPDEYDSYQQSYNETGLAWKSVNMALGFEGNGVVNADFNREDVANELTDDSGQSTEFSQEDSHKGYDIYVLNDEAIGRATGVGEDNASPDLSPIAYAVSNSTIVLGGQIGTLEFSDGEPSAEVSAIESAKNVIDAGEDGSDRATDDSDAFQTLTNELNDGDDVNGRLLGEAVSGDFADAESGRFEGLVAEGTSISINGNTSERQKVLVFDSAGDADEGDIDDWVDATDSHGAQWDHYRDISVNVNDNVGTVTGTIDTYDLGAGR